MNGERWISHKRRELGLPASANQRDIWIADVKDRPRRHEDTLCGVTGKRRLGKSTLARKLAFHLDARFSIERQCCFSIYEVQECAEELQPGQVVIWDEIIEGGMARDFQTGANRDMEKFFTICGDRELVAMPLAPHIDIFDATLRKHYLTDWILKETKTTAKLHTAGMGGDYPGKQRGWLDLCRFPTTPDEQANDAVYRAKKDGARRGIFDRRQGAGSGASGPESADLLRLRQAAAQIKTRE